MSQVDITSRNAGVDAVNSLLNGGTVEIRTGAPAPVDSAPTGTILATLTINATAFAAAVNGTATANAIAGVLGSVTGTAGHYVARDSGSNVRRNGTAGIAGTDMILSTADITLGENVSITSWTFGQPTGTN